jgi:hypothetical protein
MVWATRQLFVGGTYFQATPRAHRFGFIQRMWPLSYVNVHRVRATLPSPRVTEESHDISGVRIKTAE